MKIEYRYDCEEAFTDWGNDIISDAIYKKTHPINIQLRLLLLTMIFVPRNNNEREVNH